MQLSEVEGFVVKQNPLVLLMGIGRLKFYILCFSHITPFDVGRWEPWIERLEPSSFFKCSLSVIFLFTTTTRT